MKTVSYKGFQASVEYEDRALFLRVLHIDDLLVAEIASVAEIEPALKDLVDAYLQDCAELGREPQKPFSGTFNIRVGVDLHRKIAMAAAAAGVTLNAWVSEAISEKLECSNLATRMDNVVKDMREEVQMLRIIQSSSLHEAEQPKEQQRPIPELWSLRAAFTQVRDRDWVN